MSEIHVIADGGGTSTNWCVISNGKHSYFTTESYHPINWNQAFKSRISAFWKNKLDLKNVKLSFFGAGCFQQEKQLEAQRIFEEIGFARVFVQSDLHGAGRAVLGDRTGWVAIAGTGSVLFYWDGSTVIKRIGGKGYELGDEGSGYYFGKLIVEAYENQMLSTNQNQSFSAVYSEGDLALAGQKFYFASMAQKLGDQRDLFQTYHEQNISLFIDSHLSDIQLPKLYLVGGYAWHQRELFASLLRESGVKLEKVINEPIQLLVEQMVHLNE